MFRTFDLSMDIDVLEEHLNNPDLYIISCRVNCSESGFTTATLRAKRSKEKVERKRHRKIERFLLFDGRNPKLDNLLDDEEKRIIRNLEFVSEQGVIIVVDYEYLRERS